MKIRDEMEYVKEDLIGLSESDKATFHNVIVHITPHWKDAQMTVEYYFKVTIYDDYDSETDSYVTRDHVTVRYWGKYDINLVELLESDSRTAQLEKIFGCDVMIGYANYDIPYDEELSRRLEDRLQSTWECIYCTIHDL